MRKIGPGAAAVILAFLAVLLTGPRPAGASQPSPEAVAGELVMKAPPGMSPTQVQALADAADCRVVGPIAFSPGYYLLAPKGQTTRAQRAVATAPTAGATRAATRLASTPGVLVSPNWIHRKAQATLPPNDPLYSQQWDMRMINMPQAWAIQVGGRQVRVAVIDTGLDIAHPEFTRPDGTPVYMAPRNVTDATVTNNTNVADTDGHGTHVAGTVAAVANNGVGIAGVGGLNQRGVDIRIVPIKASTVVIGTDGIPEATFTVASIVAAVNYAVQQGASVINMSLAGQGFSTTAAAAIAQAQAQGVVVVAALGNEGIDTTNNPRYPAGYTDVIAVSAVGPNRTRASYSNIGGNVTIAAPGGDGPLTPGNTIVSPVPISNVLDEPNIDPGRSGYAYLQGTSMAAPHVSGVVALLYAAGAQSSQIRPAIQNTAQRLNEFPRPGGGFNSQYGAGLIDAYEALRPFVAALTQVSVSVVSPTDLSTSLYRTLSVVLEIRGVAQLRSDPDATLTVVIRTATTPTTVVATIPVNLATLPDPPAGSPFAPVRITLPEVAVAPGNYLIEMTLSGVDAPSEQRVFVTVALRTQPAGRSMFSVPFLLPDAPGGPEAALFGSVPFVLHRWNPFADNGLGDYARFSSTGAPQENAARFRMLQRDLSPTLPAAPLTYDATQPAGSRVSLAPIGLGYWLDLAAETPLNVSGPTASSAVAIELFPEGGGWNQIGAPFTFPVDWNVVSVLYQGQVLSLQQAIDADILRSAIVGYARGDYVFSFAPLGQLVPFEGYWVQALQRCTLIVPPVPTTEQSVTRGAAAPRAGGWRVRIGASVAGDRDGQNYFGQATGARDGDDSLDVPKPPSGAGHAYVRFLQKGASGRASAYAFDLRPAGAARQEWTLAVTTDRPNAEVVLSWDGLSSAPRRTRFVLKDKQTGETVALRSRSSHRYRSGEAGETREFLLSAEPEASAGALVIRNLQVASSGGRAASAGVSVRFALNRAADISGVVKTLGGKTVARLTGPGRSVSGDQITLHWNRRGSEGAALPAGPYIVEITARGEDGQITRASRTLMVVN